MYGYTPFLEKLIKELSKMPTIGPKSAERMALYLLRTSQSQARELAEAIVKAKENTRKCRICNYFAQEELCPICQNKDNRERVICVVEDPQDVIAIERTGRYKGLYHVLWGKLSPLEGVGPGDLPLQALLARIKEGKVVEIIIATSSNREGETTALYLKRIITPLGVKITRIARGIPVGSNIGYIDQATISEALEGRQEVSA
ncbi:MAG: recombination protein RecR [PVC group bacterium]|nr:recombination protein RecR [PVC group bacterium]